MMNKYQLPSRVSVSKKSKPADGADQRKSIKSICIIQRNLWDKFQSDTLPIT